MRPNKIKQPGNLAFGQKIQAKTKIHFLEMDFLHRNNKQQSTGEWGKGNGAKTNSLSNAKFINKKAAVI